MAFRGLFIGIDRYESPHINELNCARRDAVALEALFTDTLGGQSTLLVNSDATRDRIEQEFAALASERKDRLRASLNAAKSIDGVLHLAIPHATRKAAIESLPLADSIQALNSHFDKLSGVQLATSSIGLRPKKRNRHRVSKCRAI